MIIDQKHILGIFLFLGFLFAFPSISFSQEESSPLPRPEATQGSFWKEKFQYSGELAQETAFRFVNSPNFSKIRQFVKMDLKFNFTEHFKMKIGGRAWYDMVYDVTNQYPEPVENNMRKELALRDAYLDFLHPKVNIRLGHQQIVWGEALGQFFADVVTPKDLREFFLRSFDFIRLPIWALDIQYNFVEGGILEFVVTPDQTVDKIALQGADFAPFIPPPPPGFEQQLLPEVFPEHFKNWNGGVRVSYLTHGWDLAWFYFTAIDQLPFLLKDLTIDPLSGLPLIQLTPVHRRIHQFATTFSKQIKSSHILRGEFVYTHGRYFDTNDITVNQGVAQEEELRYVIGFDSTFFKKVDMNAEFQQQVIFGDNTTLQERLVQSWLFFRFETGFFEEKLVPEFIVIIGLQGDGYVGPRIHYQVIPSVRLTWGADILFGPKDTLYGQFNESDRVFMNTVFSF